MVFCLYVVSAALSFLSLYSLRFLCLLSLSVVGLFVCAPLISSAAENRTSHRAGPTRLSLLDLLCPDDVPCIPQQCLPLKCHRTWATCAHDVTVSLNFGGCTCELQMIHGTVGILSNTTILHTSKTLLNNQDPPMQ